jgi:hypothetical protein
VPLAEAPMAVLATALRDPRVVLRDQTKIVTVPARTACCGVGRCPGGIMVASIYVATVTANL